MADGLRLTREHYRLMLEHVELAYPHEACGLAGGNDNRVETVIPVTNASEIPAVRYFMEPAELLRALIHLEGRGMDVAAIYHSHPSGPPHPSPTDLDEYAYPGAAALIWSRAGSEWQARCFRIREGGYEEAPVILVEST